MAEVARWKAGELPCILPIKIINTIVRFGLLEPPFLPSRLPPVIFPNTPQESPLNPFLPLLTFFAIDLAYFWDLNGLMFIFPI
jgi:hypothetical protein